MVKTLLVLLFLVAAPAFATEPGKSKITGGNPVTEELKREAHEYRKKEMKAQWEFDDKQMAESRAFIDRANREARETQLKREEEMYSAASAYTATQLKDHHEKVIAEGTAQKTQFADFHDKQKKERADFEATQKRERDAFSALQKTKASLKKP